MRRVFVCTAVAIALAVPTAASAASGPSATRLQAEVTALQKQVKALTTTVKTLTTNITALKKEQTGLKKEGTDLKKEQTDLEGAFVTGFLFSICEGAVTADLVQGTWSVIDQLSAATQAGKVYFGPQTPVSDVFGMTNPVAACRTLSVARSQAIPPTFAPFSALYALLRTNALSSAAVAYSR